MTYRVIDDCVELQDRWSRLLLKHIEKDQDSGRRDENSQYYKSVSPQTIHYRALSRLFRIRLVRFVDSE